jgi:hypothetical protein
MGARVANPMAFEKSAGGSLGGDCCENEGFTRISTDDTDQEPATVGFPALLTKCREHSVQDGGLAGMGERRQRLPERSSRVVMNGVLRDPSLNS